MGRLAFFSMTCTAVFIHFTHREPHSKAISGGPPVGIFAQSQYRSETVLLHDGDVLVAYTDGVVEALNPQQVEFGKERLSNIIRLSLSFSAAEICKRIAEGLQAFVAECPQWDDVTFVVMKVKPE